MIFWWGRGSVTKEWLLCSRYRFSSFSFVEKGARRSSRSSALDALMKSTMVQQCQGNSSNTPYKRYALIQKKTVVAADGTSSHLLKHTSLFGIKYTNRYKFEDFSPKNKKSHFDFLFWLLLLPFFSSFFFLNRLHSCLCPPGLQCVR